MQTLELGFIDATRMSILAEINRHHKSHLLDRLPPWEMEMDRSGWGETRRKWTKACGGEIFPVRGIWRHSTTAHSPPSLSLSVSPPSTRPLHAAPHPVSRIALSQTAPPRCLRCFPWRPDHEQIPRPSCIRIEWRARRGLLWMAAHRHDNNNLLPLSHSQRNTVAILS